MKTRLERELLPTTRLVWFARSACAIAARGRAVSPGVRDQLNHERYIYIDMLSREAVSRGWLEDIVVALGTLPYWGVGITNVANGYVLIFSNMLLVAGSQFTRQELEHVLEQWRSTLVV
jgi:hypothetical protein